MNLVKNTLGLCIALAIPTYAADLPSVPEKKVSAPDETVKFYGKLNISLQSSDESSTRINELKSNASRVGVKGKYKLDHGLTAIYKLEWQVNVDDDDKNTLTARNQWVGVRGGFGEVTIGRADTTLKVSQGKFDLFNDYAGDLKHLFIGENRVTDSLTYKSPKFNKFQFLASYILSEDKDKSDPYSIGVTFGDLNLKKTDYFIAVAHDENMPAKLKETSGSKKTIPLANTRVTGMYKFGDFRIGGIYTETELTTTGASETGYAFNASYKIGKALAKVQYQEFAGADGISFGVDYKLGKSTKVYAWYTDRQGISYQANTGEEYTLAKEGTYYAIGIQQKF